MAPKDPIADAIKSTEQPAAVQMNQTTVTISSTGRPMVVAYPVDVTDSELLEFIGWVGSILRAALAEQRQRPLNGRLEVVRRMPG